jgi:hypothetical protein
MTRTALGGFGEDWPGIDLEALAGFRKLSEQITASMVPTGFVAALSEQMRLAAQPTVMDRIAATGLLRDTLAAQAATMEPIYERMSDSLRKIGESMGPSLTESIARSMKPHPGYEEMVGRIAKSVQDIAEHHQDLLKHLEDEDAATDLLEQAGRDLEEQVSQLGGWSDLGREGVNTLLQVIVTYRVWLVAALYVKCVAMIVSMSGTPGSDPALIRMYELLHHATGAALALMAAAASSGEE